MSKANPSPLDGNPENTETAPAVEVTPEIKALIDAAVKAALADPSNEPQEAQPKGDEKVKSIKGRKCLEKEMQGRKVRTFIDEKKA